MDQENKTVGTLVLCSCITPKMVVENATQLETLYDISYGESSHKDNSKSKHLIAKCKKCGALLKTIKGKTELNLEVLEQEEKVLEEEKLDYLNKLN